jgi:hypothetical protein
MKQRKKKVLRGAVTAIFLDLSMVVIIITDKTLYRLDLH